MAYRQQFLDRIDNGNVMTACFQQACHDSDRHFFATANKRSVNAVRALSQQADAMQDMFNLGEFLFNKGFERSQRKTRLRGGQTRQQLRENTFGVADIG